METVARRSRGQLLIITAISLSILLVLMALALNTAVYGVVHGASADDDVREERSAVRYEDGVRRGVAGLIPAVDNSTRADRDALEANLSRAVANWSRTAGRTEARDGVATNVTLVAARFETDNDSDDPRLTGADVRVTYRSPDLHYSTVIRVEPGDSDA